MIYSFMNDFGCFLHFYERLLFEITHFYERLWVSLLAAMRMIPTTDGHRFARNLGISVYISVISGN